MAKGGSYEREICKELSRWWTQTTHFQELIFWRTSNSGGGATVRHRAGIKNKAHAGDIAAIEETGRPLTELITFEIKRGYNKTANVHTLLDLNKRTKNQMYELWILQAMQAAKRAGTPHWMILHRRDGREPFCFFPSLLFYNLRFTYLAEIDRPFALPILHLQININRKGSKTKVIPIVGMKWKHFLFHVDPSDIRKLWEVERANSK